MNMGDLVFQVIMYVVLFGLIFSVYFAVRLLFIKPSRESNIKNIEQKLDRIIKLLEKDKKD